MPNDHGFAPRSTQSSDAMRPADSDAPRLGRPERATRRRPRLRPGRPACRLFRRRSLSPPSRAPPPHRSAPTRARLGPADPAELLRADAAFAAASLAQGARAAFLAFAAENAVTLSGGGAVRYGRQAIGATFDGTPAGAILEWAPVLADVARTGDLG